MVKFTVSITFALYIFLPIQALQSKFFCRKKYATHLYATVLHRTIVSVKYIPIINTLNRYAGPEKLTLSKIQETMYTFNLLPYHKAIMPWICLRADRLSCSQFFRKYNIEINKSIEDGLTPLHYASWAGNTDVTKWLVDNGARTDKKTEKRASLYYYSKSDNDLTKLRHFCVYPLNGETPLHFAQNAEIASYLLQKNADPNETNLYNETPLLTTIMHAALRANTRYQNNSILEYLPKLKPVKQDDEEQYIIYDLIKKLLDHDANPNIVEINRWQSPLHYAYKYGFYGLPSLLYQYKAMDDQDCFGNLPRVY